MSDLPTFKRLEDGRILFRGIVAGRRRGWVGDSVDDILQCAALELPDPRAEQRRKAFEGLVQVAAALGELPRFKLSAA